LTRLDFAEQLVHQRYMAWVRQHVLAFCLSTRGRPRQQVNNTALQCFGATFEEALAIRHIALLDLRYPAGREADQRSEFAQAEAAVFAPLSDNKYASTARRCFHHGVLSTRREAEKLGRDEGYDMPLFRKSKQQKYWHANP
jgi:hypothetical protein